MSHAVKPAGSNWDGVSQAALRDQLERVLASPGFARSERLTAFLRFVVEETLGGRGNTLKEPVIGAALYAQKAGASDPDDAVVRTDARRVRDKLREYYAESPNDPVLISLPKGSYAAAFTVRTEVGPTVEPRARPSQRWRLILLIALVASGAMAVVAGWRVAHPGLPPPRIVPLTQLPGGESDPSFSPDGNFVAFSWWSPPGPSPQDIWIKDIRGEGLRRLTDTPAPVAEHSPAWSPDGREIAFARVGWQGQAISNPGIYIISVLGGAERRIAEWGANPRWTPDGNALLISHESSIVQIDLATLRPRTVVERAGESIVRLDPSPDGLRLAFIASKRPGVCDIFVVPAAGGTATQLTAWGALMTGLTWTADSKEIIYDVSGQSLWRIPARGGSPGKGRAIAGLEGMVTPAARASKPVVATGGPRYPVRLGFQVQKADVGLRLIALDSAVGPEGTLKAETLADSTRVDVPGAFSPDGQRLAFFSMWSGVAAPLWVVNRDGSNLRQFVQRDSPFVKPGGWSPDGKRLVFEGSSNGNSEIYTIDENGGDRRQVTRDPAVDTNPTWSLDGKWIYFCSNRTGTDEVWRAPAEGGPAVQMTRGGGLDPLESADGRFLLYLERAADGPRHRVLMMPAGGGKPVVLPVTAQRRLWGVNENGLVVVTPGEQDALDLFPLGEGPMRRLGRLPFRIPREFPGITFSRDGRWA